MKILITGANSAIALKLSKAFEAYNVLLADYGSVPTLKSDQYQLVTLGTRNEDTVAHQLLNFCLDHEVDMILPLHQFELMPIAKAEVLFKEFNITVLLPTMDMLNNFENVSKSTDLVVLNTGEVLFSTLNELDISAFANLSGAFDAQVHNQQVKLSLLAIC